MSAPVIFVLIVREDGTAIQLSGVDACAPWQRMSEAHGDLWASRGWASEAVQWEDGSKSYAALKTYVSMWP